MKFSAIGLKLSFLQDFYHTYRHTDRHFLKIVKSYSGHPKRYKSIKNRKQKLPTKSLFSTKKKLN